MQEKIEELEKKLNWFKNINETLLETNNILISKIKNLQEELNNIKNQK